MFAHNPNSSYETILEKNIDAGILMLSKRIERQEKCLIIDDGAKAIQSLHTKYPLLASKCSCVEQTSRGALLIRKFKVTCPVVDVARSETKTIYESPMIARAMVDGFFYSLKTWTKNAVCCVPGDNILLLGYGFIGENVAKILRNQGFVVNIYDTHDERLLIAKNSGLITTNNLHDSLEKADIVIGCSGTQVLCADDFLRVKSGAILVNMASTDIEFNAQQLRSAGKIVHQNILSSDIKYLKKYMPLPWRSLYMVPQSKNRYFYLANGWFPMDFCGKINPVPLNEIQLTYSLLLIGAVQSAQEKKIGLFALDPMIQKRIISEFLY